MISPRTGTSTGSPTGHCAARAGIRSRSTRPPLALGEPLPVLPLTLTADLILPVDFEGPYADACRRKRLT